MLQPRTHAEAGISASFAVAGRMPCDLHRRPVMLTPAELERRECQRALIYGDPLRLIECGWEAELVWSIVNEDERKES